MKTGRCVNLVFDWEMFERLKRRQYWLGVEQQTMVPLSEVIRQLVTIGLNKMPLDDPIPSKPKTLEEEVEEMLKPMKGRK